LIFIDQSASCHCKCRTIGDVVLRNKKEKSHFFYFWLFEIVSHETHEHSIGEGKGLVSSRT